MTHAKAVLLAAMLTATGAYPTGTLAAQSEDSHWFAFQPARDDFKETILDCSRWVEAPTGKHGFVTAKGEQFVFEDGTPVHFWGAQMGLWGKEQRVLTRRHWPYGGLRPAPGLGRFPPVRLLQPGLA